MRGPNPLRKFKNLGVVTTPYGSSTTQEDFHPGVDIANKKGTPIPAFAEGVVEDMETGHMQGENNFGNMLAIRDQEGNLHQYSHLEGVNVRPGQRVRKGQKVATLGNSGATYSASGKGDGSNLDYRIVNKYSQYLNPMTYLNAL